MNESTYRKPPSKAGGLQNVATKGKGVANPTQRAVVGLFVGMQKSVHQTARLLGGRAGRPTIVENMLREVMIQAGVDWRVPERKSA